MQQSYGLFAIAKFLFLSAVSLNEYTGTNHAFMPATKRRGVSRKRKLSDKRRRSGSVGLAVVAAI